MTKSINSSDFNSNTITNLNTILGTSYVNIKDLEKDNIDTYDALAHAMFAKHVPGVGAAKTVGGEIIRALSRVCYRYYNDGDVAGYGYGVDTAAPALGYLVAQFSDIANIADAMCSYTNDCSGYEKQLDKMTEAIILNVIDNCEIFSTPNTDNYSDDSYTEFLFDDYNERLNYGSDSYYEEDDYYDEDDDYYDEDDDY